METSLVLDSSSKQLGLSFKKRFEHSSDVSLKVNGILNTVTSKGKFQADLSKVRTLWGSVAVLIAC
jgi:hypothetical protein